MTLLKLAVLGVGLAIAVISGPSLSAFAQRFAWEHYRLSFVGFGPVRIGMTVAQASKALGIRLKPLYPNPPFGPECDYVYPQGNADAPVGFMISHGRIVRIELAKSQVKTVSGAHLGMLETQVKALYHPLEIQPHKYTPGGHYLVYRSRLPVYQPYSMLFETDGHRVTEIRAGKNEAVSLVEGCS